MPNSFFKRFRDQYSKKVYASVDYHIKAYTECILVSQKPLVEIQSFFINENLNLKGITSKQETYWNATKQMLSYCCVSRGNIKLKVEMLKTKFKPGEEAYFYITVDNSDTKIEIEQVIVNLYQYICVKTWKKGENSNRLINLNSEIDRNRSSLSINIIDPNNI